MKKAKILLAAIAVFALVGGAYAFKAQRSLQFIWVRDAANPSNTLCTLQIFERTTTKPGTALPLGNTFITTAADGGVCTTTFSYYLGN
jgi:hypothetical protein